MVTALLPLIMRLWGGQSEEAGWRQFRRDNISKHILILILLFHFFPAMSFSSVEPA